MITYELIVSIERRSIIGKTLNTIGPLQAMILGSGLNKIANTPHNRLINGCLGAFTTDPIP